MENVFSIGYVLSGDRRRRQQDAFISSFLVFMLIMAAVVTMILSYHLMADHKIPYFLGRKEMNILLVVIMSSAMAAMSVLSCGWRCGLYIQETEGTPLDVTITERTPQAIAKAFRAVIRQSLPLLGIVLFCIVGAFHDLFRIVGHSTCFYAYINCGLCFKYATRVVLNLTRIAFKVSQMVFCVMMYNRIMLACPMVRYGLLLVIAASLSAWFDLTIYDVEIKRNKTNNYSVPCPLKNATDDEQACLMDRSPLHKTLDEPRRYLYPFSVQFFLLAIEVILTKFLSAKSAKDLAKIKQRLIANARGATSAMSTEHRNGPESTDGSTDYDGNRQPGVIQRRSVSVHDSIENQRNLHQRQQQRPSIPRKWKLGLSIGKYICRILIMSISVVHLILAVRSMASPDDLNNLSLVSYTYFMSYEILTIIISIIGLVMIPKFKCEHKKFTGLEVAVLISTMGMTLYIFFGLIAAIGIDTSTTKLPVSDSIPWYIGIGKITLSLVVLLQTQLMIYGARVNRSKSVYRSQDMLTRIRKKVLGTAFKHIMFYMSVYNMTCWVTWTMLLTKLIMTEEKYVFPIEREFYGHLIWNKIIRIIKPIMLFYSFNSGIIFLISFLKKTKP